MARRRSRKKTGGLDFSAIPAYFWLACLYGLIALGSWFIADEPMAAAPANGTINAGLTPAVALAELPSNHAISSFLNEELFSIPMVAGDSILVSWTVVFIILAFTCSWIEAVRALKPRGKAYNDIGSILVTIPLIILLIGFEAFQTTAFLVIVIVGFGDIILDRLINQGVSYRDYYAL